MTEQRNPVSPQANVVNMVDAAVAKLIKEQGLNAKVGGEIRKHFPKLSYGAFRTAVEAAADDKTLMKFWAEEVAAAARGNGRGPDYQTLGRLVGIMTDPADECRALAKFFPWVDWPWLAKQYAANAKNFIYRRTDSIAWKYTCEQAKRKVEAFVDGLESLGESLMWGFLEAVIAERDRDSALPLAERLADVCTSWGLQAPPDDFDLLGMAEKCIAL